MREGTGRTARTIDAGRAAEDLALDHLRRRGLRCLTRNFRCRLGELDIVMLAPEGTLVFVEVRMRRSRAYGGALGSVDSHKRSRLVAAAEYFLKANKKWAGHRCRFDVVAVNGAPDRARVEWVRNAFEA